ncbi:hypothetical protein L2E82_38061 [Cichorium intybus]|uniref:Uncharacterized protein n=1 Tax=Cichorium intybus TaxID=13427 RepID=A0ACB9AFS4_CICIN|nr:hypothetical protein L2E82_38061 [Cichorium intybus]
MEAMEENKKIISFALMCVRVCNKGISGNDTGDHHALIGCFGFHKYRLCIVWPAPSVLIRFRNQYLLQDKNSGPILALLMAVQDQS